MTPLLVHDICIHGPYVDMGVNKTREESLVAAIDDGRIRRSSARGARQDFPDSFSFNDDRTVWKGSSARPIDDGNVLQNKYIHPIPPYGFLLPACFLLNDDCIDHEKEMPTLTIDRANPTGSVHQ
jgi:hypothetical protein